MKHARHALLIASLLMATGVLMGCGQSRLEIGMVETNLPGRWEASYATLTGSKKVTIPAEAGETLILDYEVNTDKGDLTIQIIGPEGEPVWDIAVQEDVQDTAELVLRQKGRYSLTIEGENAGGSFDLSWKLE